MILPTLVPFQPHRWGQAPAKETGEIQEPVTSQSSDIESSSVVPNYIEPKLDAIDTVFRTSKGNFYHTMMPFGLMNAGATYQHAMTHVLGGGRVVDPQEAGPMPPINGRLLKKYFA